MATYNFGFLMYTQLVVTTDTSANKSLCRLIIHVNESDGHILYEIIRLKCMLAHT